MYEINKDINKAKTLNRNFYLDDIIFEDSKKIFKTSIQPICTEKELKNISIYPFKYFPEFLNENLIITTRSGEFLCFPNVCTHRGHLLAECSSKSSYIKCGYHGRMFDLEGVLKNAPGFENALNFPSPDDNLNKLSIYNWNGFLFVSLYPNQKMFEKLKQIDELLPQVPYSSLSDTPIRKEYVLDCHWTLYCDNYLEGLHIPYVHKGLNNDMEWKNYKTYLLDEIILQKAVSKKPEDSISYTREKNIYAYYFFIFPNIMINYYNWGISINIIEPISKKQTRIRYIVYNLKNKKPPSNPSSSIDTVELEDQRVVLSVQDGINSENYTPGKFSPELEQGVHYFHRLISERLLNFEVDKPNKK